MNGSKKLSDSPSTPRGPLLFGLAMPTPLAVRLKPDPSEGSVHVVWARPFAPVVTVAGLDTVPFVVENVTLAPWTGESNRSVTSTTSGEPSGAPRVPL